MHFTLFSSPLALKDQVRSCTMPIHIVALQFRLLVEFTDTTNQPNKNLLPIVIINYEDHLRAAICDESA